MNCPICNELNCQYLNGSKKMALSHHFYDSDGRFHNHDGNVEINHFRCSNGHVFTETNTNKCWCDWPDNQDYIIPKVNNLSYFPN